MQNPQEIEAKVGTRYRVFLILWVAIFVSMAMFLGLTLVTANADRAANPTLSLALIGVALMLVISSFFVKQRIVQSAIEKRDVASLQSGYIVSFALCESAALFALLNHFITASTYYYFAFAIAFLGMLLHFPKKDHIRATV